MPIHLDRGSGGALETPFLTGNTVRTGRMKAARSAVPVAILWIPLLTIDNGGDPERLSKSDVPCGESARDFSLFWLASPRGHSTRQRPASASSGRASPDPAVTVVPAPQETSHGRPLCDALLSDIGKRPERQLTTLCGRSLVLGTLCCCHHKWRAGPDWRNRLLRSCADPGPGPDFDRVVPQADIEVARMQPPG